jgi:hypothetical protein
MCGDEARARARALLMDYLSPDQRRDFETLGHFDVVKTGSRRTVRMFLLAYPKFRVYRLSRDRHPVKLFTSEEQLAGAFPRCAFCVHSSVAVIQDDELLSMKLLLEHDEPRFLRIAHATMPMPV